MGHGRSGRTVRPVLPVEIDHAVDAKVAVNLQATGFRVYCDDHRSMIELAETCHDYPVAFGLARDPVRPCAFAQTDACNLARLCGIAQIESHQAGSGRNGLDPVKQPDLSVRFED